MDDFTVRAPSPASSQDDTGSRTPPGRKRERQKRPVKRGATAPPAASERAAAGTEAAVPVAPARDGESREPHVDLLA